jgi:hypothetical protein
MLFESRIAGAGTIAVDSFEGSQMAPITMDLKDVNFSH